jgi:hypothetical protein
VSAKTEKALLLDETPYTFWDAQTDYRHTYHLDCLHPAASDDNPGTEDKQFATINQAASHYSLIELLVSSRIVGWLSLG